MTIVNINEIIYIIFQEKEVVFIESFDYISLLKPFYNLWDEPIVIMILIIFSIVAAIHDAKTLTITNKLNGSLFLIGGLLMMNYLINSTHLFSFHLPEIAFGWGNIIGMIFAFLALFIPAMIKNHPMGGDIKFLTIIGFWVGFPAILLVIFISAFFNLLYWYLNFTLLKKVSKGTLMPFGPFIALSLFSLYLYGWLHINGIF